MTEQRLTADECAWPHPEHIEHIQFEGRDCVVLAPEEYEALFVSRESLTALHALDQAALEAATETIAELKKDKERLQNEHDEYVATAQEEYKALELELMEALNTGDGHCFQCGAFVGNGAPHAWKCPYETRKTPSPPATAECGCPYVLRNGVSVVHHNYCRSVADRRLAPPPTDVQMLIDGLSLIAKGPPGGLANDEVASWAGWIAHQALDAHKRHAPAPPTVSREQLLALLDDYHLARVDRECCGDEFQQQYVAAIDSILAALRAPAEQVQTCPTCGSAHKYIHRSVQQGTAYPSCSDKWHAATKLDVEHCVHGIPVDSPSACPTCHTRSVQETIRKPR